MDNITFMEPKREILSPMDMPKWMKSQAYHEFLGFIMALNNAIKKGTTRCNYVKSEVQVLYKVRFKNVGSLGRF